MLLRGHCQRMGWEVVGEYVDAGISGKEDRRPQLLALMHDAHAHCFDVIVVHKLDRFFRNLRGLLEALDKLRADEVAFVSISENLDFTTPWGKLIMVVLGTLAEIYIDNLLAETSKGKKQRAREGYSNASILPYGYLRNEEGEIVPEPFEAEGIRLVFEAYAQGRYSDEDVAGLLNQAGHRTRQTTRFGSRPWTKDTITMVLKNSFYVGQVRHGKVVHAGKHEPIISQE